jgi:CRP-like cAMP-binding protein
MRFVASLDKALHLRTVPLFGDLPPERLALLVAYATEELVAAGAVLQVGGDPVGKVRVIVEGKVAGRLPDGTTFELGADAVVGVSEYFAGHAPATLSATTDLVVLSIPTEAIYGILEDHFDVVVHIFRGLGRTLIRTLRAMPTLAGTADPPAVAPHGKRADLDEVEQILALRNTLPFRRASVDGLAALAQTTRIQTFEPGQVLWKGTDDASWLGVILDGVVECETPFRTGLFYFSESGTNAVGFLDTLGDDKRWYEARATTDVRLLTIQKDDLLDTLEDRFDMALACLAAFSEFGLAILLRLRDAAASPPNEPAPSDVATLTPPSASNA